VLLDDPLTTNLPVVPACLTCNNSFSADEEYLACLIACVVAGSTDPKIVQRPKAKRLLSEKPALRARIETARQLSGESTEFVPEYDRVCRVMLKLAQGHALYELHEQCIEEPAEIFCLPLARFPEADRIDFESPVWAPVWPEVGSRAMQRLLEGTDVRADGWIEVQPGRYRYCAQLDDGIDVRIVVHEYLACKVRWEP
jgi:hypothetical protein